MAARFSSGSHRNQHHSLMDQLPGTGTRVATRASPQTAPQESAWSIGFRTLFSGVSRSTLGQVDAILAAGGCHDHDQMQQVYAASGGLLTVDHPAEEHLLRRCWPSVLALAASLYQQGEVGQDDVLKALGLTRANAAMGLAMIRSGESPRITLPYTRF